MGVSRNTNSYPASRNVYFDCSKNNRLAMTSRLSDANRHDANSSQNERVVNPGEVLLATFEKQCVSTWRWIRSWALKLEGDANGEDRTDAEQPAIRISHSLPDLNAAEPRVPESEHPVDVKEGRKVLRQITMPSVPIRHQTFQRQLSRRLDFDGIEFKVCKAKPRNQNSIGEFRPELYSEELQKQNSENTDKLENTQYCGRLRFTLKYDFDRNALILKIIQAHDLPVKDLTGSSDPYVKVFLLPDRKKKYQTKVHRKNLNPVFDETFIISVNYDNLRKRQLQLAVYDFDRFSRHDLIGQVVMKSLLNGKDLRDEIEYNMKILYPSQDKMNLGEIMLTLCYLPTAGRLTVTVVKARHLRAMDITGSSDPYVKIYLICGNKRIRKKRTTVKRRTLNPVYNEALTFDVPSTNVEEVSLLVKVIDYDRIGYDELMGCVGIGASYIGTGKDHWVQMLDNTRKPVALWHTLGEPLPGSSFATSSSIKFNCLGGR